MRNIDDYSKVYSPHSFEDYQVAYRRKKVLEQIRKFNPQSILEIGVGSEPIFQYVDNIKFTIVEPSKDFYENARRISRGKVRCLCGFFEEMVNELEQEYDMILCSGLLHEVEQPMKLLKAIVRLCHENTVVHINVPNANSLHRLVALASGIISDTHDMSQRNSILQQHRVFDIESLVQIVEESGLSVLNRGSYFIKPFAHEQMYNMLKAGIINENILDGFYKMEKYIPDLGSEIYVNCKCI